MLGFGLVIPVLPFYSLNVGASPFDIGLLLTTYSFMQFIFSPYWGKLSDKYGRKPFLIIGLGGFGLAFSIFGLSNSLWQLYFSRIIGGIISSAAIPSAMAYIGDNSPREKIGHYMGLAGASMGLGIILGPVIGGYVSLISLSAPFFLASALAFSLIPIVMVFICDTNLSKYKITNIKSPTFSQLFNNQIGPYLGYALILSFAIANLEGTFALFTNEKFGFGTVEVGNIFAFVGFISVVVQIRFVGNLINKFGEDKLISFGFILISTAFFLIIVSWQIANLIISMALIGVAMGILRPSISSKISKNAKEYRGQSLGLMSSMDSLGRILGPSIGCFLFEFDINFPYFIGMSISLIGFLLFKRFWNKFMPNDNSDQNNGEPYPKEIL